MLRRIDRAIGGLLALLGLGLIAMIGLSTWNVVARYVLNRALLWADEVAVFSMIALAFLGAVVCAWRQAEIRMDILSGLLPAGWQRLVLIAQNLVMFALCAWVAWQSLAFIRRALRIGMRSDAAGIPIWLIHSVIPASLAVIALIAALRALRLVLGRPAAFAPAVEGRP